ncbi:hypothetical protein ACP70R_015021 [Stipagrostis hirtigluma subsp. patula]
MVFGLPAAAKAVAFFLCCFLLDVRALPDASKSKIESHMQLHRTAELGSEVLALQWRWRDPIGHPVLRGKSNFCPTPRPPWIAGSATVVSQVRICKLLHLLIKKDVPASEKPEPVRTHLRNMIIVPEMIGSVVGVYNGKTFNQVEIKPEMIGNYLAEFSISYKPVKHGRPGIGATHCSRFIPLKCVTRLPSLPSVKSSSGIVAGLELVVYPKDV